MRRFLDVRDFAPRCPHVVPTLSPRCPRALPVLCGLFLCPPFPPVNRLLTVSYRGKPQHLSNRYLSVMYYLFGVSCRRWFPVGVTAALPLLCRCLNGGQTPFVFRLRTACVGGLSWSVGYTCVPPFIVNAADTNRAGTSTPFYSVAGVACVRLRNGA